MSEDSLKRHAEDDVCNISKKQKCDQNFEVELNSSEKSKNERLTIKDSENIASENVVSKNINETELNSANQLKDESVGLREYDVGITEYVNNLPGFSGIIKERYSDFLVNEIDPDGNVVRLTHMNEPQLPQEIVYSITDVISEIDFKNLKALSESRKPKEPVIIDVTEKDKDARRKIHESIRKNFQGLDSSTEDRGSSKVVVVKKQKSKRRRYHPPCCGNYTHFVLYKENKDTLDAINYIASVLRLAPKSFSYAGTKDKRAKTSQMVSVYRVKANQLLGLNKKMNGLKVGNIEYKNNQIKLGDLSGNKFSLVLRQLKGNSEEVDAAMTLLMNNGFLNYYGMQRFGTSSVATHSIGRALLQGKWKEAIDLILKPKSGNDSYGVQNSCKIWHDTHDANLAYENLNFKSSIEGRLLSGLVSHGPNDSLNALNAVPRNIRLMYIHSYQSYIWNKIVSKRMQNFGFKVLIGDLILSKHVKDDISDSIDSSENLSDKSPIEHPQYVTDDDLKNGITLYDIVLPLPGHKVLYPQNEIKDWYEELLKEDNMDFDSFQSKVKTYSLSGAYRKIIIKPTDVKWDIVSYNDVSQPLSLSDLDILNGLQLSSEVKDGAYNALKMELTLPSSSYATMAVREVLKVDTCLAVQKNLSVNSKNVAN